MTWEQLTIVFDYEALATSRVLDPISALLQRHGRPPTGFGLGGESVSLEEAAQRLRARGRVPFHLSREDLDLVFGRLANQRLDFLKIKMQAPSNLWDEWAEEYCYIPAFTMAWLVDYDYDYWQNAEDPLQYEAAGRSYQHLPIKSNDLPPPLDDVVIDISRNPGRWSFRTGYVEAVGTPMWLSERFWRLTGTNPIGLAPRPGLRVSQPAPGITKLIAADEPFTSAEGASRAAQDSLRALLFAT